VAVDSSYRIIISSINHPGVADTSDHAFAVGNAVTGIVDPGTTVHAFALDQNFPNPFNPSTVISYQLPKSGPVALRVYDVLGKEVRTLVEGEQSAGSHTVTFDASSLSSGVYFYRMQAGNFVETKRLVILR